MLYQEFNPLHLNIFLCSNEDVFLFKTLTERPGDLEDCIALSRKGLDWNRILSELKHQMDKQSYENKMKGEELNKLKADMEDLKGNLMKELKDKLKKEILSESRK